MATIRIGISGWTYAGWRGDFYPPGLAQRRELAYAAERFSSIEINGSFYSLQRPSSYRTWRAQTPEDFVFAVKGGRFITHMKKLRRRRDAAGQLLRLRRPGPRADARAVLWQLPPNLGFDADRLRDFFDLLPRTTAAAAPSSRRATTTSSPATGSGRRPTPTVRCATRWRSGTTRSAPTRRSQLLREHDIALVVADTAGQVAAARADDQRLHATSGCTATRSSTSAATPPSALDRWADADPARGPTGGQDVFVYFDNDVKVHAPYDAMGLMERLGLRGADAPPVTPART